MRSSAIGLLVGALILSGCGTESTGVGDEGTDAVEIDATGSVRDVGGTEDEDGAVDEPESPGDVLADSGSGDPEDVSVEVDVLPDEPEVDVTPEPELPEPDIQPVLLQVEILEPLVGVASRQGDPLAFRGRVEVLEPLEGTPTVQWVSDLDGLLDASPLDGSGETAFVTDTLSAGIHEITLEAVLGGETASANLTVGVCGFPDTFTFDADLDPLEWEIVGDATRDSRGWLEMTGNIRDRRGAIVNIGTPISEGDIRIRFDISTGQCNEPGPCSSSATGADGFAVSIFETGSAADTVALMEQAEGGGGLGYGVSGGYGDVTVNAFHIEFDTWYNQLNDAEYHTDPTRENHVGITLNGDPGNHVLFAELPTLENNEWHNVDIAVVGPRVTVRFDGEVVADEVVAGLAFKGGFLAFSGVTGYYSNYHRFDNLLVSESCDPEE